MRVACQRRRDSTAGEIPPRDHDCTASAVVGLLVRHLCCLRDTSLFLSFLVLAGGGGCGRFLGTFLVPVAARRCRTHADCQGNCTEYIARPSTATITASSEASTADPPASTTETATTSPSAEHAAPRRGYCTAEFAGYGHSGYCISEYEDREQEICHPQAAHVPEAHLPAVDSWRRPVIQCVGRDNSARDNKATGGTSISATAIANLVVPASTSTGVVNSGSTSTAASPSGASLDLLPQPVHYRSGFYTSLFTTTTPPPYNASAWAAATPYGSKPETTSPPQMIFKPFADRPRHVFLHDTDKCADEGEDCCASEVWGEPQKCADGYIPIPNMEGVCSSKNAEECSALHGGVGCYGCYPPGPTSSDDFNVVDQVIISEQSSCSYRVF